MIEKNNRRPNELKENLEDIENIIRELERNVDKEAVFISVGKTQAHITSIFNQIVGVLNLG
jgi:flagellar biosynthesis/type III secretory pathway chaperone